jgi:hypothetical protein
MRYIGPYPLIEDNAVRPDGNTAFDAQVGYLIAPNTRVRLDVFNLFNAKTSDITYYYDSRLPGELSQLGRRQRNRAHRDLLAAHRAIEELGGVVDRGDRRGGHARELPQLHHRAHQRVDFQ